MSALERAQEHRVAEPLGLWPYADLGHPAVSSRAHAVRHPVIVVDDDDRARRALAWATARDRDGALAATFIRAVDARALYRGLTMGACLPLTLLDFSGEDLRFEPRLVDAAPLHLDIRVRTLTETLGWTQQILDVVSDTLAVRRARAGQPFARADVQGNRRQPSAGRPLFGSDHRRRPGHWRARRDQRHQRGAPRRPDRGEEEVIECGLVLRSIGYRGKPVDDVPFDDRRGLIRNTGGRVCAESGDAHTGQYVVGWIKRGPSGVIGTNKKDSADTVAKIVEDRDAGKLNTPAITDPEAIAAFYAERAPDAVTWAGWQAIDAHEKATGEPHGRPRVKLVRLADLVERSRATSAN